ncbi:formin-like protein 11 [Wolffia australiana]
MPSSTQRRPLSSIFFLLLFSSLPSKAFAKTPIEPLPGGDYDNNAFSSPLLNTFRLFLGLPISQDRASFPPSPSPSPAASPPSAWPLRRPFFTFSTSPLPRPSRVPSLRPEDLPHATSLHVIVISVAGSAAACLVIMAVAVALLVVLLRRKKGGETEVGLKRTHLGHSMDKVSFDPARQVFYLEDIDVPTSPTTAGTSEVDELLPEIEALEKISPPKSDSESLPSLSTPLPLLLPPVHPPPPPPPPPVKRVGPPPPPPPPPLVASVCGSALPKLKPLHWDKVRAAPDRTMVWDKIRCSSFELDEKTIGSLFSYNMQGAGRSEDGPGKATCSPGKRVLEPKRLQNLTILLKAVNATSDQVRRALTQGSGLSAQQMEALVKMVPTEEEQVKLLEFAGNTNGELDPAEKFLKEVLSIPFSFARIQAMLFKESFTDESAHLRDCYSTLEEACQELRTSRLFMRLLDAVLKTGNRMNVGTIRGGAKAFKLNALLKLADVKSADGKTTLLHFVVQEIARAEAEKGEDGARFNCLDLVSGLSAELHNVKKTAAMDLVALGGGAASLASSLDELQKLLKQCMGEGFAETMAAFSDVAAGVLEELKKEERRVLGLARDVTEYFHGEMGKEDANPLGIFVIVRDFLDMLDRVCKELRGSGLGFYSPTRPSLPCNS